MFTRRIVIPNDVSLDDLHLTRNPATGTVKFQWGPLERICEESGVDIALLKEQPEDNVCGLIVAWYGAHRQAGGAANSVADQLLAEVQAEDNFGEGHVQRGSTKL